MTVFSVVIPTYNRRDDLKRAVKSILSQTFEDWELIVVDNHSIDGTDKMLEAFDDHRIKIELVHNEGVIAKSRNLGVKKATGEYIAFLDSDDWWASNKLQVCYDMLEAGYDFVFHDMCLVYDQNQKQSWKKEKARQLSVPVYDDLLVRGNAIATSSVVVDSEILRSVDGMSEDKELIAIEDFDTWLRVAKKTDRFAAINKPLGYYWAGGGNVSNPSLSLKNLKAFYDIYKSDMLRLNHDKRPSWINYNEGRAHFLMEHKSEAKSLLKGVRWSDSRFVVYLKALWMLTILRMSH